MDHSSSRFDEKNNYIWWWNFVLLCCLCGSFSNSLHKYISMFKGTLVLCIRLSKRLLRPLHQGLRLPVRILLYPEQLFTLSLKFRDMPQCYLGEFYHSILYFHQMNLIYGDWWGCGPFGCSVSYLYPLMAFHYQVELFGTIL